MSTISQRDLRNDSGEIMRRVESGESFTVTRRGVAVADLVPHREQAADGPTRFVPATRIGRALHDLPRWDVEAFEGERRDLDARLSDEERDPWSPR